MADTRQRILDTAERLYAERGLDGVSLREITGVAGQRNNAAVHYHFGGRDGLLRALFEQRYGKLQDRRAAMLADLDAEGKGNDLRSLVRVLVAPFAEEADDHWVRFVARLHEDPRFSPFAGGGHAYALSDEVTAATRELAGRIRATVALPAEVIGLRLFLVVTMAVHAFADRQAMLAAGLTHRLPPVPELVEGLVEAAVAVISS